MIPIKLVAMVVLVSAVMKVGHPFRFAFVLAAAVAGAAALGTATPQEIAIRAGIALVIGAAVFWFIDRTESIMLTGVAIAVGVAALLFFA